MQFFSQDNYFILLRYVCLCMKSKTGALIIFSPLEFNVAAEYMKN